MKKRIYGAKVWVMTSVLTLFSAVFASAAAASSNPPGQPRFVSGGLQLINTATGWLLAVIPVTCILWFMWLAWQKSLTDEPGETARYNKSIRRLIIWGAVALGGDAILKMIFWYLVA